jgi:hypothetical protein
MPVPTCSQVMLRRVGKSDRKVLDINIGQNRPRYGQSLTVRIDGEDVRAKVTGVWQPPRPARAGIYMINADEIE